MTRKYDALIIGGGHNGLVCAFYLARAGLKVRVLERRDVVGGACVTEEFAPGFRNSTASYTVSLLRPKVIADMKLHDRGFRIIERTISNFFPFPDTYLKLGGGTARTQAEFARFSQKDADAYPAYDAALEKVAQVLRDLALKTPPNVGGGLRALISGAGQGWPLAKLGIEAQRDLLDVFTKSARDFLDRWFEDDHVKSAFAFDAVVGNYAGVSTPGSAYVLLHHVFGEVNGKYGAWGHSVGGMGAITQAMAAACVEAGVEISLEAPVETVLTDGGPERTRAAGVRLVSGEEIAATVVAANVGPALLYRRMVDAADLPADFKRRMDGFKTGSGTFRMNVALSELPDFTVLRGKDKAEHHTAGIIIAPGMDYMDQAFIDAQQFGWSKKPIVEMKLPTTVDDSLAPPGQHIASLFCQQFDPKADWDAHREAVADLIVETVNDHAPNFKASILARQIHSPLDLERKFGLIGGDIFHGTMGLDQLWAARPTLGHGDYRSPIAGLYMCGSGTHPGGGVTGAPGHNAAHEILRDRSLLRRLFG
ncbi:phytoene desaturase family protein [Sphingomonas immobilis]|uniref:Pyridine nucleotide-disulfide oxidoreductase domain-containing protein 2 n=1 Tax=Sphingomonas immobilis TaxID=3063997 RepID=A0ABT9A1N8_9SPHN|nr:NAD(P)/FAD-dependent oxidoreductase [Sphingomonas sp. CA1-15]MDO7842916.1 NAD(P)/FAD-dependent oxidoreductase [Sphingomonas sp. CA1-15]